MKATQMAALTAALMVIASTPTHAEFVVGLQGGLSANDGQVARSGTLAGADFRFDDRLPGHENGVALGVFGQYRHALDNGITIGIHLGYANDSTEWERSYVDDPRDSTPDTPANDNLFRGIGSLNYEADATYDILGLIHYDGKTLDPFVMFGYSALKADATLTEFAVNATSGAPFPTHPRDDNGPNPSIAKGSGTLSGWKLAAGFEYPFSDRVLGHALAYYAAYGDEKVIDGNGYFRDRELSVRQTGIRIGIGYRF